ncbi:MAG: LysE family translocator [Pseudonocardia sp.]|uniref:LysE family translocator n=1 Tax=unclassified Pseudonocardia TaxID=2619320 RepID=UPI0008692089|nr:MULTISPECIES: LysE family translocator [unclassified Pseudonocardia]MBN9111145.1 LysE family translocator [Pseudonocardia sp.]ODU20773.1 MAG: lysine transporter LysE [Pseudonocardia sp. SCN 72-51]ODV04134.1 MAG: lysine transporter LysE [Pseudonocardia sp. SCN 73-27]
MTWTSYSAFLLIAVLLAVAPGPDTLVLVRNALAGGRHGGMWAWTGITLGNLVQGSAAALGLGVLIARSQTVFTVLRWVGAAYLLVLGVQTLRAARRRDRAAIEAIAQRPGGSFRRFREGFLSDVTNPKVLVVYLSVLPQFLVPGVTTTFDALLLAYTVAAVGAVWLLGVVVVVHRVQDWLGRRRVRRAIDTATGTALLGFAAAMVME